MSGLSGYSADALFCIENEIYSGNYSRDKKSILEEYVRGIAGVYCIVNTVNFIKPL